MIKIALREHEIGDAEKANHFYLRGEVADEGYSGWSDIVVAEEDLKYFLEDLKGFARKFEGAPELKAGWGDEVYFRMRIEKWKMAGTIWVGGEIATPARARTSSNPSCSHRLLFGFPAEPGQLDTFLSNLYGLIAGHKKEAVLESAK